MSTYEVLWHVTDGVIAQYIYAPSREEAMKRFGDANPDAGVPRVDPAQPNGRFANEQAGAISGYVPPPPDRIRKLSDAELLKDAHAAAAQGDPKVAEYILKEINRRRVRNGGKFPAER